MLDYNNFKYMTFGRKNLFNEMLAKDIAQTKKNTPIIYSTPEHVVYTLTYNHVASILREHFEINEDKLNDEVMSMILNYGVYTVDCIAFITKLMETIYAREMFKYRMLSSYRKSREKIPMFKYISNPTSGGIKLVHEYLFTMDEIKFNDILRNVLKVNMDSDQVVNYNNTIEFIYHSDYALETLFMLTEYYSLSCYIDEFMR